MLKIKDNVDLKELEKYGFKECNEEYIRSYKNEISTFIWKETRIIEDVDVSGFLTNYILGESKRVNDLIKDGLVVKVDE